MFTYFLIVSLDKFSKTLLCNTYRHYFTTNDNHDRHLNPVTAFIQYVGKIIGRLPIRYFLNLMIIHANYPQFNWILLKLFSTVPYNIFLNSIFEVIKKFITWIYVNVIIRCQKEKNIYTIWVLERYRMHIENTIWYWK